ncbi:unnamed protein product [Closterium sp. Naga37s-1]|nr:unnamed protein product [Closterium sp. Naga37s-1]
MMGSTESIRSNAAGLACLFDAHSLRWRLVKLGQGDSDSRADSQPCSTPRSTCHRLEEPWCPSRPRLWTTDDPPLLDTDESSRTAEAPRVEIWVRGPDFHSPSDLPPSPSPPPPALAGAAEAKVASAAAAAAAEGRHAAPFLVDELMGMEQLRRVMRGGYYSCSFECADPVSSLSTDQRLEIQSLLLPDGLRTRLQQLLSRHQQHVSALHMPVTVHRSSHQAWPLSEMMGLARSCVNLRSLHLVSEPPTDASCPIHEDPPSTTSLSRGQLASSHWRCGGGCALSCSRSRSKALLSWPCKDGGGASGEARVEGDVGKGACGAAAACFFPFLEELVLCNVSSHAGSHTGQGHVEPAYADPPPQQQQTLAFMGVLPRLTHLAIHSIPSPSHPPMHAPTILSHLLPNLTFLRIHSPPRAPLPVLPHLRTLIVGSYPHSSRFLASLALFPALTALRIFNLSMHNYHSALSCPPQLTSLQICHSHTPLLPDCLRLFSSLTRLHLFQCTPLRALPSFLSSFSSLTHFNFGHGYDPVVVQRELKGLRQVGREDEGEGQSICQGVIGEEGNKQQQQQQPQVEQGDCRTSHHETRAAAGLNGSPLFSSVWLPSDSPFWLIHSSPTSPFSLLPSSQPPFTLPPPITPSSLSTCFTHYLSAEKHLSPIWFASLPSPSSLAHTLAHYPNLSTLALPLVSTTACPLRPSHLRSLLAAAAALPAPTSLSLLLEPGFSANCEWGYGREGWFEAAGMERRVRRWWGEANQEMERGLFAVLKRCRGLKQLHLQGETLTDRLKLPDSLFLRCPQLTALSLPLSRLPSSLLLLSRLTSLALALPADPMPPRLSLPSPFAPLRSLRSLALHVPSTFKRYYHPEDGSSWSSVSGDLLLGLPSCLSALSLHLPISTMPSSFSCLTSLTRLDTNLWIPGLDDADEGVVVEEEADEEVGEVAAEEESNEEEEEVINGLPYAGVASRVTDERLLPLCNLTSLSLSRFGYLKSLIPHLTRLTSLALPSLSCANDLSRLTRLHDLFLCCSDSACLPHLPRLRRLRVQCPDFSVHVARFIARVAPSLEQLDVRADRFRYSEGNLCAPLFPALEHMALAGNRDVAWKVESGFSANLRFLHLDRAKLSGYESEPQLTQLTALTTLVVDNADCRDFLACLSCFSSLHTLRLSNITRGCSQPYLTCPPRLATLQICCCDLPHLPSSLVKFSRLTRLDLLHWRRLHSLPPFLSAFTSLRHFRLTADGLMPHVPPCLNEFLEGREWYEHSPCDGSFED